VAAKFIAKKLGVPEELIRSNEEMTEAAQQLQQFAQTQQQEGNPVTTDQVNKALKAVT
jgi:hypothetical protein